MVTLPKIDLGRKKRRNHFNFQHDVEATASFGYCMPVINKLFPKKDTRISLETRSVVRLAPMPCPTFGRIEAKTHTAWVPMEDVFLGYDYLQSAKSVTSAVRSYVPSTTDNIGAKSLFHRLLELCRPVDFNLQYSFFSTHNSLHTDVPFYFRVYASKRSIDGNDGDYKSDYVDVLNDDWIFQGAERVYRGISLIQRLFGDQDGATYPNYFDYPLHDGEVSLFKTDGSADTLSPNYGYVNFPLQTFLANKPNRLIFGLPGASGLPSSYGYIPEDYSFPRLNTSFYGLFDPAVDYRVYYDYVVFDIAQSPNAGLYPDLSLDACDFKIDIPKTGLSYKESSGSSHALVDDVYIGIKLTPYGRKLLGYVLPACGHNLFDGLPKELPHWLANYKVWFDKYNPGREIHWKETNAYKLIHSFYDCGVTLDNLFSRNIDTDDGGTAYDNETVNVSRRKAFFDFLVDLGQMYYTLPIDNMTAATDDVLLNLEAGTAEGTSSGNSMSVVASSSQVSQSPVNSVVPYGVISSMDTAGGLGIKLLTRLYHLVNKNSVIGSRINEYLISHGISRGLPESNVLGDSKYLCNIDDVFSTVNNEQTYLGEYAAKGIGSGSSGKMYFESNSPGYLIQLFTLVPLGGYVQASKRPVLTRYEYYQDEFDSLGKQSMLDTEFIGREVVFNKDKSPQTFGFVPRYFNFKVCNNTSLGGFCLSGEMQQFLPYTLNRLFSIKDVLKYVDNSVGVYTPEHYQATEELRYIGKDEDFGNYDRIFYDTTGRTDNFIVHIIEDLDVYQAMKSVSDSYDTLDDDQLDDDVMQIKAS